MAQKLIDLKGLTFWAWTVLERAPNQGNATFWKCRCICGHEGDIQGYNLRHGLTKQCMHCQEKDPDITGKIFGNWTALSRSTNRFKYVHWLCKCKCGIKKDVRKSNLETGASKGCRGCFYKRMRS